MRLLRLEGLPRPVRLLTRLSGPAAAKVELGLKLLDFLYRTQKKQNNKNLMCPSESTVTQKTIVCKNFLAKIIWNRNIPHPIPSNDDRLLRRQFLPVLLFLFLGVIGVFGLFLLLLLLFVVYAAGASLGPAILPAALALKSENFKLVKLIFFSLILIITSRLPSAWPASPSLAPPAQSPSSPVPCGALSTERGTPTEKVKK